MLTEDYLMRMINMALAALAHIVKLKTAGQRQQALQEIDRALEQLVGMRADLIRRLDDASLLVSLTKQEIVDTDRLALLADLFKEEGDIYKDQRQTADSYMSYLRSLSFYLEAVFQNGPANLEAPDEKIEALVAELEAYELPPESLYGLFSYYEERGQFARAEAALSRLQEISGFGEEMEAERLEFYARLQDKTDEALEAGGLPRARLEQLMDYGGKQGWKKEK